MRGGILATLVVASIFLLIALHSGPKPVTSARDLFSPDSGYGGGVQHRLQISSYYYFPADGQNEPSKTVSTLYTPHTYYDTGQLINFTLNIALCYGGSAPMLVGYLRQENVTILGDGIDYTNIFKLTNSYGQNFHFSVTPSSAGTMHWNLHVYSPKFSVNQTASVNSTVEADPSGSMTVSLNRTVVGVGQDVGLRISSTISGGTQPYDTTVYENGKTLLDGGGLNLSFPISFSSPGTYVINATTRDAANWTIHSNNVTITVPSISGSIFLKATHTKIYISESTTLILSSTLSGGTPPYNATWYENGKVVLTSTTVNLSFSPKFNVPGNYTFHAAAYDSAGVGPFVSNNVTIQVYGLPSEQFIHTGMPVANVSYAMGFSIPSPVSFSQTIRMPDGSIYSGGNNVSVNYTFLTAGVKIIRSQISWNGSIIENLTFNLSVNLNVQIIVPSSSGLSPFRVHFNATVQGSSNYSYYWILMPGVTSNLSDPSLVYPYGNWTVSLVVNGNNGTSGQDTIVIHSGLSASMRIFPDISVSMGTVYLNASVTSNYTIDHVYAMVNGLSGTFNVSLNLTGFRSNNYSYSATMDEFSLLAGNYTVNLTAISSVAVNRSSSEFTVNFSFAQVTLEPDIQISGGLLNLTVTAISDYTVHYVSLQVSGPSGITDYNLTLNYYKGTTSRWDISIDEYALGNGIYSALISAHNSRGFTDYSSFPFNVSSPNQGFSLAQFISDIGGPVSFLTLIGVIVMAIGVAVGIGQHGTETVYIGGQKYKAKPGKPLKRVKGGKK